MKVRIITDVVLAPVIKEFRKMRPSAVVEEFFEEEIITWLLNYDESDSEKADIYFIHSDQHFHKKPVEWQNLYLSEFAKFAGKAGRKVLLSNGLSLSFLSKPLFGSAGILSDTCFEYASLLKRCYDIPNVFAFDFNYLCWQTGVNNVYQYNLGHLYQMPYTKSFFTLFGQTLSEQIAWLCSEEKKAIILDCDNTLWKGVVGEDGVEGIICDKNPSGILFYNFQSFLKAKKEEGFLLCLCSKNNENEVREAFDTRKMPLEWNDFVIKMINWEDKWQNINRIATTLNIAADSFIFIDDNAFEINSVKELIPGISAFGFNDEYESFLRLTNNFLFKRKKIVKEDIEKSKQYETEFKRQEVQNQFGDIDDFIRNLNIELDIKLNDSAEILRLSQMTGKTNQFNFNKREYTTGELKAFIEKNNRIYLLKASDKFGDYGIVGLIMIEILGQNAIIENFLMSCRALGKKIEDRFYDYVISDIREAGLVLKEIRFKETAKNKPAQDFLKKNNHGYNYSSASGNIQVGS